MKVKIKILRDGEIVEEYITVKQRQNENENEIMEE